MDQPTQLHALNPNLGQLTLPQFTASKVLYSGVLTNPSYTDIITVPEKKTIVITNFWVRCGDNTERLIDFRSQYPGGQPCIFLSILLGVLTDTGVSFHLGPVAKVLESGTVLSVAGGDSLQALHLSLEGTEIQTT